VSATLPVPGIASGSVRILLRLEAAAVLVASVVAYRQAGGGWGFFALLFLAPDLSMIGYLAGPRAGAINYNAVHSYVGALGAVAVAWYAAPSWLPAALVWVAHIAWDRAIGYGLKYPDRFGHTHLGLVGRARA
jgi:hypothetical protein